MTFPFNVGFWPLALVPGPWSPVGGALPCAGWM